MLNNLEELPEFESNPFDGKTDVPLYEIALITSKIIPQTEPPYQLQETVGVVGRTADGKGILATREWMKQTNGKVMAIHGNPTRDILIELVDRYEILVPHNELNQLKTNRRL